MQIGEHLVNEFSKLIVNHDPRNDCQETTDDIQVPKLTIRSRCTTSGLRKWQNCGSLISWRQIMSIDGLSFVVGSRAVVWICNLDSSNSTVGAGKSLSDVLSRNLTYFSADAVDTDSRFHVQTFTLWRRPVNEPTTENLPKRILTTLVVVRERLLQMCL